MTKTHKTAKITAVALTLAILAGMFCMFGTASANAATARVSLYNSGVTFAKYGMTTSEIFVKTNDNANDQQVTLTNYCEEEMTVRAIYVNGLLVYALKPITIEAGGEASVKLSFLPKLKANTAVKVRVDFQRADQKIKLNENAIVVYTAK